MLRVLATTLSVALASCAGGPYVGAAPDAAILRVDDAGKSSPADILFIHTVNGKAVSRFDTRTTALSPGPQRITFELAACSARRAQCEQPATPLEARFEARAGRLYSARVEELVAGSQVYRVWIADDTGAIVAPAP